MKKEKKEEEFNPEYLLIPRLAMQLPAADRMVFGAIYMFCQLSKKKCTASNVEIGRIAFVSGGAVANSLNRLEEIGLIKRYYKDEQKKNRDNMISLWGFGKLDSSNLIKPINPQMIRDSSTDEQIKNKIKNIDILEDKPLTTTNFNPVEELERWKASKQPWLRLIGIYGKYRKVYERLQTKEQLNQLIPEFRKVAVDLSVFTDDQLREAFKKCDSMKGREGESIDWTLRTVKKVLLK